MFDFVGKRFWFFFISILIAVPCILSLSIAGFKTGIDFRGGTAMTLSFEEEVSEEQLRNAFIELGYGNATIQRTGDGDYFVRMEFVDPAQNTKLLADLGNILGPPLQKDQTSIDESLAARTVWFSIIAVCVAALGILLYVTFAFRKMPKAYRWGICTILALIHDIVVVAGVFSILGWTFGIEIDALFITGMLTVVGYSVHNTIVVFDRIRENMLRSGDNFMTVVNNSILQTITRSLNTSLTLLFVLFALFLIGGSTIKYFVLVLIVGGITGTFSSMFIAGQLLVVWEYKEWYRFIPFYRRRQELS